MLKILLPILVLFIMVFNTVPAISQTQSFNNLADRLAETGHRDINIVRTNNSLTIQYWPIGFRDEYQGYVDAKKTALNYLKQIGDNEIESLEFVQTSWGTPVIKTTINRERDFNSEVFVKDYHVNKNIQPFLSPSRNIFLLFDIPVRMNFGRPYDPFIFKTGIRPELRLKIRNGLIAYGQVELYAHNEYDVHEIAQPSRIGMLYMKPIHDNILSFTNVGILGTDIYGVDEEISVSLFRNVLACEFHGGIYGDYLFENGKFGYYRFDKTLSLFKLLYFNEKYDSVLKIFGGKFLNGDKGIGGEISRIFKEVEIGLTIIKTGGDIAANGFFSIPFFPKSRGMLAKHGVGFKKSFHFKYWYYSNILGKEPVLPTSIKNITGFSSPQHFSFMSKFYNNAMTD